MLVSAAGVAVMLLFVVNTIADMYGMAASKVRVYTILVMATSADSAGGMFAFLSVSVSVRM